MGFLRNRVASLGSAFLTFASLAHGLGQAIVKNNCDFPAYLWSVSNTQGPLQTLQAGQSYSETYQYNPDGGGISIKIARDDDISGNILQVEYTLDGLIWYDLSRINGSPYYKYGVKLVPSINTCKAVRCKPSGNCGEGNVFYYPDDTSAIGACDPSANLVFTLCSGHEPGSPTNVGHHGGSGNQEPGTTTPAPAPPATTTQSPPPAPSPAYTTSPTVVTPSIMPSGDSTPCPTPSMIGAPPPPPPGSPPVTSIPPGEPVVTTFVTYYTTVDYSTTEDVVTVTAKR